MKILMLGCGAIGGCVAADFLMANIPITIADPWPDVVNAIRTRGFTIELPDGNYQTPTNPALHLSDFASKNIQYDIVFLAVKAQDARWLSEFITPYLAPNGLVVPLMNGMMNQAIAEVIGLKHLIGSVIELSAESFEPGRIKRKTPPHKTWIAIGELDGSVTPRLTEVKNLLRHSANVDYSSHIENAKWTKLVANAMILAPFAMLKATSYDALSDPLMRKLILQIGEEAIAVGQALGYQIEEIFGLKPQDMQGTPSQISEKLVETLIGHIGKKSQNATTQDVIKGRITETRFINGLIVNKSIEHRISCKANQAICELMDKIEKQIIPAQQENIRLACAMAGIS